MEKANKKKAIPEKSVSPPKQAKASKSADKVKAKAKSPVKEVKEAKKSEKVTKSPPKKKEKKAVEEEKKQSPKKSIKPAIKKPEFEPYVLKPKKPCSAFIFYNTDATAKLKEAEGISHMEAFKRAGAAWKDLSSKEKAKWEAMQKTDEERYAKQVAELEAKGYFMLDGVKSTDVPVDPKKKYGPDVVLPKRACSAYLFFAQEKLDGFKKEL